MRLQSRTRIPMVTIETWVLGLGRVRDDIRLLGFNILVYVTWDEGTTCYFTPRVCLERLFILGDNIVAPFTNNSCLPF